MVISNEKVCSVLGVGRKLIPGRNTAPSPVQPRDTMTVEDPLKHQKLDKRILMEKLFDSTNDVERYGREVLRRCNKPEYDLDCPDEAQKDLAELVNTLSGFDLRGDPEQ